MKIFLDIDGVMVHANPYKKLDLMDDDFYLFNLSAINSLNSLKIDDLEIILSTTHRFRYSIEDWKKIFRKRKINFEEIYIVGIELENHFSRKDEIEKWIKIKGFKPGDFIIIDDDKSLNGLEEKFKKRLVLTCCAFSTN